jgi:hypothetical protein
MNKPLKCSFLHRNKAGARLAFYWSQPALSPLKERGKRNFSWYKATQSVLASALF